MTSELKPCPFCGKCPTARSRMAGENEGYETTFIIRCECGSQFLAKDDLNKLGWVDAKGKAAKCKAVEGWNTRAVPDVPELVRYRAANFKEMTLTGVVADPSGEYVLYSQAAAVIAAKDAEIARITKSLNNAWQAEQKLKDKYNREVLGLNNEGDPIGGDQACGLKQRTEAAEAKLAQMEKQEAVAWVDASGMAAFGLNGVSTVHTQFETRKSEQFCYPLYAAPVPAPDMKEENERLREKYQEAVRNAFKDVKPALNSEKQP